MECFYCFCLSFWIANVQMVAHHLQKRTLLLKFFNWVIRDHRKHERSSTKITYLMRPGHIIGHVVHFAEPFVVFIQVPVGEKDFIYYVIRYFVSKRIQILKKGDTYWTNISMCFKISLSLKSGIWVAFRKSGSFTEEKNKVNSNRSLLFLCKFIWYDLLWM